MSVFANLESFEGNTSGETITFARKTRQIVVNNDSSTKDLKVKFNNAEEWLTLKPTESLSLYFVARRIELQGSSVPYRIWSFG